MKTSVPPSDAVVSFPARPVTVAVKAGAASPYTAVALSAATLRAAFDIVQAILRSAVPPVDHSVFALSVSVTAAL